MKYKLLIFVTLISIFFSCNDKQTKEIGVILPLTGPGAAYATQVLDGINLAYQELLDSNKISKDEFKLTIEDSETDTKKAINALNKFIGVDKIQFVIGELASSITLACAPIAEKNKVLMLSPGSSADEISNAGDYIFRIAPTDSYDGDFLANKMYKSYGIRKVSILYLNNDFGIGLRNSFINKFKELGGDILISEAINMGTTDLRTPITKLKSVEADALLLIAASNENVLAIKQLRQLGINVKIFAPSSFNSPDIVKQAGEMAEGVIFSAASFDGIKEQENVKVFLKEFKNKYPDKEPTTFTSYGYDALKILVYQIQESGYNSTLIKDALYKMKPFYGASGATSFDKNGDAEKDLTLFEVKNGKFNVLLDE
jgi:branched-chain amino acid transport system substrate-binding protein